MVVVDTNIIAYLFLPSPQSADSEKLLASDAEWVAPALWKSEFLNILALYLRKQLLDLPTALAMQQNAETLLAENEYDVSSEQVLSLANQSGCSAYDCEFVTLAMSLDLKLHTADRKLHQAFPEWTISVNTVVRN